MAEAALEIGIACGRCDTYSPMGTAACPACGNGLLLVPRLETVPAPAEKADSNSRELVGGSPVPAKSAGSERAPSEEELMDQAKHYVCNSCMTPVPSAHKFCVRCGAPVPDEVVNLQARFYSDMQNPDKARLILIRGEGMDGLSYHLKADQHVVGRTGQLEFPDDPFVSPKHANFFYRDGKLVVRDEGSLNGVYVRVRGAVELSAGDTFLAGEQLFRLDPTPKASDGADPDGTFFYSSPKYPSAFRLNQSLEGGAIGMTVCARGTTLVIGREDGDLNFPGDVYMSARHCTVEERDGKFLLTDHDSRNGTYVRIKTERPLTHGDYIFIGRKLLRVELNVN
jgi:pSer/pThr/pTyr-binding forkhead associated (FHA) protein